MTDTILHNVSKNPLAISALIIFIFAYILVIVEEFIQLRKSKPVMVAAGIIWLLIAWLSKSQGLESITHTAIRHYLLEFSMVFLFIIVAMTYVNAMEDRNVFQALKSWLIIKGLSYRQLFWATGIFAFFLSAIADNLTTALAMSAVVIAVGKGKPKFVLLACINLVVAANAGGVFSPFGDITTLMVWQSGIVGFKQFFTLFLPALANFCIPALCLHFAVPKGRPPQVQEEKWIITGGLWIVALFLLTILITVVLHQFLHLPPVIGMMLGLGLLQFFAYYTKFSKKVELFDIFPVIQRVEWDTLLFFYGVILCVGGLATLGYLSGLSNILFEQWGKNLSPAYQATPANIFIGILSALIDNIPVMFSVITMKPEMSEGQWLLVTLTAGIGGSLLSIGSAAGIALMGQARNTYTFFSHLKWSWAILLGYVMSIVVHLWWNAKLFL